MRSESLDWTEIALVVQAAGGELGRGLLGFRRSFVYEKCGDFGKVGKSFTTVDMSHIEPMWRRSHNVYTTNYREESVYIKHIADWYHDLPDWIVFLHGFPEEHNKNIFEWLRYFKRPVPQDPVYIPLSSEYTERTISKKFFQDIGLVKEMNETIKEWNDPKDKNGPFVMGHFMKCAEFMVSRQAMKPGNAKVSSAASFAST